MNQIQAIKEQLEKEREEKIEIVVNELVEGKRNIHFGIVGCDYPYYQAWLHQLPKELPSMEQDIMFMAIRKIMGQDEFIGNSCEFLEKLAKKNIGTLDTLGDILYPEYDEKTRAYHGYTKSIVTGFELNLKDILKPTIEKKIEIDKKKQLLEGERKEMKVEILKSGFTYGEESDPGVQVKITDIATRETASFICRNVFDFGYIVNPDFAIEEGLEPGGLLSEGKWKTFEADKGWYPVRAATAFELKAVKYLHKFPPIDKEIRM